MSQTLKFSHVYFLDLMKYIAMDEISVWRPGWPELFWKKIYFSHHLTRQDRRLMRLVYEQVTKKLNSVKQNEILCRDKERQSAKQWKNKFIDNAITYGHQNGNYPPPLEIISKYFPL